MVEREAVGRGSVTTRSTLASSGGKSASSTAEAVDNDTATPERKGKNPQEASSPPNGDGPAMESTLTEEPSKVATPLHLGDENVAVQQNSARVGGTRLKSGSVGSHMKEAPKGGWKKRKRARHARIANVEEDAVALPDRSRLPLNQYETSLRRRAVRKREASSLQKSPSSTSPSESPTSTTSRLSVLGHSPVESARKQQEEKSSDEYEQEPPEQYGDVSLGMKLTIVGGRVIVQALNALSDGRASPAQLTGVIQRGDVLISVDHVSLVNMPLNQLVEGLKPLSTPLDGDSYQRTLQLRFAAGEGLALLNKSEAQLASKAAAMDAASDMFSLSQFMPRDVPMVDQLSGLPMFPKNVEHDTKEGTGKPAEEPVIASPSSVPSDEHGLLVHADSISVDQKISFGVADQLDWERKKFTSDFFTSGDKFSELLRPSSVVSVPTAQGNIEIIVTQADMLEQGGLAIAGAKVLCYTMEDMDKGKDTRSFKKWNSQISLRSRASSRRKYLLETASRGDSDNDNGDSSSSVTSDGSSTSEDLDGVDGDELLLGLAAHDEIWRRQVLDTLHQAAKELEANGENISEHDSPPTKDPVVPNLETSLSMELGSLLFGAQMSRILTKKQRPLALPPEEVTSVLFDLTTNLTAIMPDHISLKGKVNDTSQSNLATFVNGNQSSLDRNVSLASRFVVNEALPAWLKSFRPLPWDQRRVLWPRTKSLSADSHTIGSSSHAYSDENLTLDSESTGSPSRPSKNLQEQIEDMELDIETRAETCYLVTVFFVQVLLPKVKVVIGRSTENNDDNSMEQEAIRFVDNYGAYLKLDTSLLHAAEMEADGVITALLRMAKYDLCHQDAMKQMSKANVLLLYEPAMLSAILKRLRTVRQETRVEHRRALISLCASAFPDVRPWQVRKACGVDSLEVDSPHEENGKSGDQTYSDLYYDYLCLLLHPSEGHDMARHDGGLVEEWCKMSLLGLDGAIDSTIETGHQNRHQNFYTVASTATSDHRLYSRDLVFLLNLSMNLKDFDLALDVAGEIIDGLKSSKDKKALSNVLSHLRTIAKASLNTGSPREPQNMDVPRLRRILRLFHNMASKSQPSQQSIVVSDELYSLLLSCRSSGDSPDPNDMEMTLIDLLANNAAPKYFLQMLVQWTSAYRIPSHAIPFVHRTLLRGAQSGVHQELSGSLLRIKDARQHATAIGDNVVSLSDSQVPVEEPRSRHGSIWSRMHVGEAVIEK